MVDTKEKEEQKVPEKETPNFRELFLGKVREAYPDEEISEDGGYEKAVELLSELPTLRDFKRNREEVDAKLQAVFEADPKLGALFAEIVEGKRPFRAILAGHYTPEDLVPQDGDDDYEAYAATLAERKKQFEAQKEQESKMLENIENAEKAFDEFSKEKGFDDKAKEEFHGKIHAVLQDMADGVLTPETLSLFYKGLNYEKDKAEAAEIAELKGRNAKVQEEKSQKPNGDGLPDTSRASGEIVEKKKPEEHAWIDSVMGSKRKVL